MYSDGGMILGSGFMWIFWILIIVAIVWLISSVINTGSSSKKAEEDSPLEVLKRRYANGEIDDDEYIRKRNQLKG